jgi:hypothetical protein
MPATLRSAKHRSLLNFSSPSESTAKSTDNNVTKPTHPKSSSTSNISHSLTAKGVHESNLDEETEPKTASQNLFHLRQWKQSHLLISSIRQMRGQMRRLRRQILCRINAANPYHLILPRICPTFPTQLKKNPAMTENHRSNLYQNHKGLQNQDLGISFRRMLQSNALRIPFLGILHRPRCLISAGISCPRQDQPIHLKKYPMTENQSQGQGIPFSRMVLQCKIHRIHSLEILQRRRSLVCPQKRCRRQHQPSLKNHC